MKQEIQRVLQMNKDGKLTDEQAAELIEELSHGNTHATPGSGAQLDWNMSDLMGPLFSKFNDSLKSALDSTFDSSKAGKDFGASRAPGHTAYTATGGNNTKRMSRLDTPEGSNFRFTDNVLRMSSLRRVRLDNSEMCRNTIDASKVDDLNFQASSLTGGDFRASALDDWALRDATLADLAIQGCKVTRLKVLGRSRVERLRLQGSALKSLSFLEESIMEDLRVSGAALNDVRWSGTEFRKCELQAVAMADSTFSDSRLTGLILRGLRVVDTAWIGCDWNGVTISGLEKWSWKKQGFKNVRFENCRLEKCTFTDCRFTNVTLRNLTLVDRNFHDVELIGQTLDGDEAFLKAVGQSTTQPS